MSGRHKISRSLTCSSASPSSSSISPNPQRQRRPSSNHSPPPSLSNSKSQRGEALPNLEIQNDSLNKITKLLEKSTLISLEDIKSIRSLLKKARKDVMALFLRGDGLHLLHAQLLLFHLTSETTYSPVEVQTQYELLLTIKSAMNSPMGLEIMTSESDLVSSLALNIDSLDVTVCTQTLELLSVLMVSGENGSKIVLEALDFFKLFKRERVRFQCLVDALISSSSSIAFKRDILFFLNTVVNTSIVLEDRLEVRADLVYAGMLPTIEKLKMLCFDELGKDVAEPCSPEVTRRIEELHELESQLQVFETVLQRDNAECITDLENTFDRTEVNLSDPEQIFQSLLASTVEQECFSPFLSTLQTLLMIPSYDTFGKKQWMFVEEMVKAIVTRTMLKDNEMTENMLEEAMRGLDWKLRVEELSREVDMLALRCQTLEGEESVLKDELEELRMRESSLQYLRSADSRESPEKERLRQFEQRLMREAEQILQHGEGRASASAREEWTSEEVKHRKCESMTGEELERLVLSLETQLEESKKYLASRSVTNSDISVLQSLSTFDECQGSFSATHNKEVLSESGRAVKPAVSSESPIPQPPPLPTDQLLTTNEEYNYSRNVAPPLPSEENTDFCHAEASSKPKKPAIKPSVPMRSLFWTRIPENRILNTVWERLSDEKVDLNIAKLEQYFCKVATSREDTEKVDEKKQALAKKEKSKVIALLDSKVQQNVGIALAKFRMSTSEICRAIIQMDSSRLDLEKLLSLRALVPSSDDISVLKEYDGEIEKLGKVDRFFLHIIEIPRYVSRLDCFIFMQKFQMQASELYRQFDTTNKALNEVESSQSFEKVLEIVLAIGNYLNGSTPRGASYGFKLEGLQKLSTVKSVDNKMTLMHFLVKQCKSIDARLLSLRDEFSYAEDASRVSLDSCKMDILSMRRDLSTVEGVITAQLHEEHPDEEDRLVEVLSPFREEAASEIEKIEEEFRSMKARFHRVARAYGGDDDAKDSNSFFGHIHAFVQAFTRAYRDVEKRRIMKDKLERKRAAEERAKKARRDKKIGASDAETLIDDVFFALKGKKADEIIDSLKSTPPATRRLKSSKRRPGRGGRRRVGAAEEFHADDDDLLAAMMQKLGVESRPSRSSSQSDGLEGSSSATGPQKKMGEGPKPKEGSSKTVASERTRLPLGSLPSEKSPPLTPRTSDKQRKSVSSSSGVARRSKREPSKQEEDDELMSFLNRKKSPR